ncbi:hypothetical protein [Nitrospirillum iridis]|uniref:Uncharacterized protein n=1 Tax=Nitrospirillum iridis TaxID=765888 RepID=A0A7X0EE96_9PROT|nr:hypothetical protein [Nitrospirillum iridis]MBB6253633.1 hypothetical protein [Nitrospirillum iridis]
MTPSVQSALSSPYPDPALTAGNATAASAGQGTASGDFQDQLGQQVAQQATAQAGTLPGQAGAALTAAKATKDNHMSFWDVVDIINPLQHIPVVSTLYREITGDTIKAPAKILGGLLYGGPIGMALATGDAIVEEETGEDVGGHVMDALGLGHHHKVGQVTAEPEDDDGGKGRSGGRPQPEPDKAPTADRAPVPTVESMVLEPQVPGAAPVLAATSAPNPGQSATGQPAPGQMVRTGSVPAGSVPGLATPAGALRAQGQAFPNLAAVPAMAVNAPSPGNPTQALAQQASQVTNAAQAMAQAANAAANIGVGTQSMPTGAAPQLMPAQAAAMAAAANPASSNSNGAGTHLGQKQAAHGLTLSNYRAMAGAGAGAPTSRTLVAPSYIQNIKSTAGASPAQAAVPTQSVATAARPVASAQPFQAVVPPATAATSHPAMIQLMDGGGVAADQRTTTVPQAIQAYNNAMGQDTATLLAQATAASASINGSPAPMGASAQPPSPQWSPSQPAAGGTLSASAVPPAGSPGATTPQNGATVISNASGGPPPLPKQFIADIMMANLAKYQAMKDAQAAAH